MNNILNLYKPVGPSSFFMVQSVKRTLKVKKAGHIGTLDPKAEGVLPICLDQSTRLIQFLVGLPKVYLATMTLGIATDTQDATGQAVSTGDASHITEQEVREVLAGFQGQQEQTPPDVLCQEEKRGSTVQISEKRRDDRKKTGDPADLFHRFPQKERTIRSHSG